jgi:hypothetical protein
VLVPFSVCPNTVGEGVGDVGVSVGVCVGVAVVEGVVVGVAVGVDVGVGATEVKVTYIEYTVFCWLYRWKLL